MVLLNSSRRTGCAIVVLLVLTATACAGEWAREFSVAQFDGAEFRLSEQHENNVVVVNFWYPSCPPCREELPEFQSAWEDLEGEPVRFLGLFVPKGLDNEYAAKEFVDELGLTFHFATDREEAIATAYDIEFYPTTVFIAPGGELAEVYVGQLDRTGITERVRELIDG